ncbi:MAG: response regulator, partial [Polyangiales bacterium]
MKLKRKVLVVEDNPDDVAMLRRYLARDTEHDNVVLTSGSVDEGLHLAEAEQPDLCIVDQRLRGGNGLDLLRGLRDRNCQHAIVFLSGKSGPAQHSPSSALALGADDYLVKDEISGPQLLRALNNAVVKGQLRRELVRSQAQMERHSARVMRIQEMASELTKATSPKQVENAFCQYGPRLPSVYAGALYQAQGGTLRLRAS